MDSGEEGRHTCMVCLVAAMAQSMTFPSDAGSRA